MHPAVAIAGAAGWTDQVFAYCERGSDPGFWAEPLNAASNSAFILVAMLALDRWRRTAFRQGGGAELILVLLAFCIGIGSFLFHTLATRWARAADTIPIGIFMIGYLGYALRNYLALDGRSIAIALAAFLLAAAGAGSLRCGDGPCFNGSLAYLPALAALAAVGTLALRRERPIGRKLMVAGLVFAGSLVCRSIDQSICAHTLVQPEWHTGTHAAWHVLNAVVIHLLLSAMLARKADANFSRMVIGP